MTDQKKEKKFGHYVRVSQKAVVYDPIQDKFLIVKVRDENDWYYKNLGPWEFIGGSLKENESLSESIKREIKEEAGDIDFEIIDIINTNEYDAPSGYKIVPIYLVKYKGGEIKLCEEHSEFQWLSAGDIIENEKKEYKDWLVKSIKKAAEYLENQNALDSWKRCQADFENYKKDQARHQEEFRKYAKMDVMEQILPVVDNFEASLAHVPEKSKENKWVEGIVYIKKQLEDVLKNNDIEEIAVKAGDKFNPEIHEAVGGDGKKQKVTKVIQKGYKLNGRILRAARVEVG
jgi:molecular chaperone GrpE